MIILLVNEPVHFLFNVLKIQPILATAIDLRQKRVIVTVLTAALRVSSDYVGRCKFAAVQTCYVGFRLMGQLPLDLFAKHVKELVPSFKFLKLAADLGGNYVSAALYPTHLHTQMPSLNNNHNSVGM